jgi:hypothetical protein
MEKIASPNQLVSELQSIIARVLEAKEPSRREIAAA